MENKLEVLCNLCGNSCCPNEKTLFGAWKSNTAHGLIDASVTGGYESYHLFDLTRYTFSLCEKCLRQLFIKCVIKPKLHDVLISGGVYQEQSWESDLEGYEYRVWCDEGNHHQAYLNKKCNFVKDCPNQAVYTQLISKNFTENCCCEDHKDLFAYSNAQLVKFISNTLKPFL